MQDSLSFLQAQTLAFRDARDWSQFHTPKDLVLGLTSEVGELAEVFLWRNDARLSRMRDDPGLQERLGEELADVFIYLLYLADTAGVHLGEATLNKLRSNAAKYPVAKAKGNAQKYTDLA